jgi:ubiquinone/menaquinone biosynthesis C-methylase UbiE
LHVTSGFEDPRLQRGNEKVRRSWAKQAQRYDKSIGFVERHLFGPDHLACACSRAVGQTLEVAVGTGLNLPHYPSTAAVTGIDLSPEMLAIARDRAARLGVEADLREGDAHRLDFAGGSFDTVLATYSLCNIPDPALAVTEMKRVLRDGGRLILVDHIRSSVRPLLWLQHAVEFVTMRVEGEHFTRRPLDHVIANGFSIEERERSRAGVIERLVAVNRT